ncbi:unnamed protein product [Bemisia tabaci]|uniref:Alpha-1,4-N-acetylglucosaminyltransferase n=1 Tax=Bemisia tabaci TaxID=7038 RepID=A0A9P0A1Y3_BEMTA|nr:unnamed protein product [Bemisia tabaci]
MNRNTLYSRYLLLVVFSLVGFLVYLDAVSYINQLLRPYYGPRLFCYTLPQVDSNTLEISEYKVQPNSIFFIETSCRHGSRIGLTPRQACAYESAAKAHPYSEILVLIPSQISWNEVPRWVAELTKNRNLRLLRVNVSKYLEKTPLKNFDFLSKLDESYYPEAHAADVIRLVTLWKYGGTYLDSDFIIFKPVNEVQNFVAAQAVLANDSIANGILNFNDRGKPILEALLKDLQSNFPGKIGVETGLFS